MLRESTERDKPNRTKIGSSYQLFEVLSVVRGGCKKKESDQKMIEKIGRANFREKRNNEKFEHSVDNQDASNRQIRKPSEYHHPTR